MQNIRSKPDDEFMPDVPIPKGSELSTGWMFNAYTRRVEVACSSCVFHAVGRNDKTNTQRPMRLYSTKKKALLALHNVLTKHFNEELAALSRSYLGPEALEDQFGGGIVRRRGEGELEDGLGGDHTDAAHHEEEGAL